MAVVTETFYIGLREYTRTYSDANRFVVRDGISYSEACDPADTNRAYTEGDTMDYLDTDEYSEAGRILMGVEL